ncbi:unnamed protein product [Camellia sinensis]
MDTARRVTERGKTRTNLVDDDLEPFDFDRRSRVPFYFDDPAPSPSQSSLSVSPLPSQSSLSLAFSLSLASDPDRDRDHRDRLPRDRLLACLPPSRFSPVCLIS